MPPSSRRRRVGAPSGPKPHHLAFPAPERSPICGVPDHNHNQNQNQNPSQNPDRNQMDLISHLPDCLLSSILLLLPIRDSVRTSILSSRWRDIWKLNPLHLDDFFIKSNLHNGHETRQAITGIASVHPGPIHSFHISQFDVHPEVDDLIETLTRKGIRDLVLSFGQQGKLRYRLPFSLLECQTLRKVSLSDCYFSPSPVLSSSFPNLKELTLEFVFLWDDLLHCLLKSCAQLEVLQLINCTGLQYARLNCAKLQKLTIHECCGGYVKEMVIENAPELRSLRLGEKTVDHTRFLVQHVEKLEVLGFFSMDANMRIGKTFSKSYNEVITCLHQVGGMHCNFLFLNLFA